jgi:hypothetical protein
MLLIGLTLLISGCRKEPDNPQDLESVREDLRQQVADGDLTREEAIVKLAEAKANIGFHENDKKEVSQELETLGNELKAQIENGQITEEEAKEKWIEAAKKAKVKSEGEKGEDSVKETK